MRRRGGVLEVVAVEAVAGIAEMKDDGARGLGRRDFDHFLGVEAGAMLHRVEEHLSERGHQQVAIDWNAGAVFGHEARQPVGGHEPARHLQRDPVGKAGRDLDAVAPVHVLDRGARHVRHFLVVDRSGEARVDVLSKRLDDVGARERRREHDRPDSRPQLTELVEERQVFGGVACGIGHDDVERAPAEEARRLERSCARLDVVALEVMTGAERPGERRLPADEQQPSHTFKYSFERALGERGRDGETIHRRKPSNQPCRTSATLCASLRKQPIFTLVAVATLTLGIGANTAIFSLLYQYLLRPLPYPDAERLVFIWNTYPLMGLPQASVSIPDYIDRKTQASAIEDATLFTMRGLSLAAEGEPVQVRGLAVTPSFFTTLRRQPFLGRAFAEGEAQPGADKFAILTYNIWNSRFAADRVDRRARRSGWAAKPTRSSASCRRTSSCRRVTSRCSCRSRSRRSRCPIRAAATSSAR